MFSIQKSQISHVYSKTIPSSHWFLLFISFLNKKCKFKATRHDFGARNSPPNILRRMFTETAPFIFWEGVEWLKENLLWPSRKTKGNTWLQECRTWPRPGRDALTQWGPRACIQTEQAAEHSPASFQLTPRLRLGVCTQG